MVSIHLILLFIRFGKVPVIVTQMFQYISCYSLSGSIGELSVVNRLFQYISCYSLSIKTMVSVGIRKVSIHLMLLFIGLLQSNSEPHSPFQYISCYSLSVTGNTYGAKDVRFNTSHVTLYRKTIQYPQYPFCRFQYISCYSLSWSITDNKRLKRVSIHLMLLFIRLVITFFFEMVCFNTSHVTLYQAAPMVKVIDCKFQYISCYSLSVCRIKNL